MADQSDNDDGSTPGSPTTPTDDGDKDFEESESEKAPPAKKQKTKAATAVVVSTPVQKGPSTSTGSQAQKGKSNNTLGGQIREALDSQKQAQLELMERKEQSRANREKAKFRHELEMKKLQLEEDRRNRAAEREHAVELEKVRIEAMLKMVEVTRQAGTSTSSGGSIPNTPLLLGATFLDGPGPSQGMYTNTDTFGPSSGLADYGFGSASGSAGLER